MTKGDSDITLLTVLQHMQSMEQRLIERIDGVRDSLNGRIDGLEVKVDRLEMKGDRNHVQVIAQLDAIDRRLDEVEVVEIPKLKKMVGMK